MLSYLAAVLAAVTCSIHPHYALTPAVTDVKVVRAGSKYQASAAVRFHVRRTSKVVAPDEPGVRAHLNGHETVAQRAAGSFQGHVSAMGGTAQEARSQLDRAIRQLTGDQTAELLREERVYDNVTENGAEQSLGPGYGLPGGPDVRDPACTL